MFIIKFEFGTSNFIGLKLIRVRVGSGCNVIPWAREWKRVELVLLVVRGHGRVPPLVFLKVVPLQPNPLGM